MISINLNDIAVLNIQGIDFCCIINGQIIKLLQNSDLTK